MKEQDVTELSKFLSYVLRHKPESIGVVLDSEGWASVDAIIAGAARDARTVSHDMVEYVVATSDKKRFALSSDGLRIRAVQGHSTSDVAILFEEKTPPANLYHGTATRFLPAIREQGLVPRNRHHVHLSGDIRTAINVGARHGKPVVLVIAAATMHAQGHKFYLSENGVWLTNAVPSTFIAESSSSNEAS